MIPRSAFSPLAAILLAAAIHVGHAIAAPAAAPAAAAPAAAASPAAGAGTSATGQLFTGFKKNSKDPVQVDAATLEIFQENKQRISVFSGGVTVKRGDTTMKATTMKLYSDLDQKPTPAKGGGDSDPDTNFSKIEALGTVYVSSGNQVATGDNAVVDMKAQTITLVGDVVLSQGKNVITGDRLIVDMVTGNARVEQQPGKRIQSIFVPKKDKNGKGGDQGDQSDQGTSTTDDSASPPTKSAPTPQTKPSH